MAEALIRQAASAHGRWLIWAGYAAAGCAALRVPLHLYYGLGGTAGLASPCAPGDCPAGLVPVAALGDSSIVDLPAWLSPTAAGLLWRGAHLGTAILLLAVAALALALVRPWGRRLPSVALIVPAFGVTVVALGYAACGLVARLGRAASALPAEPLEGVFKAVASVGPTGPERMALHYADWLGSQPLSAYPMAGLAAVEPWALVLGLLLAAAAAYRLGGPAARRIWLVVVALGVLRLVV
jgi:hypothetical protein